jgi:hypothetical protein
MTKQINQQSYLSALFSVGVGLAISLSFGCVKLQKSGEETQGIQPQTPTIPAPENSDTKHAQSPEVPTPIAPASVPAQETQLVISGRLTLDLINTLRIKGVVKNTGSPETYIIHVDNLIFKDQAILKTDGFNLEIETKHLLVEGKANLVTFTSADKAGLNSAGRSGGRISIHALLADGQLDFILNGENGGNGSEGAAPGPEKNGAPGANGVDGQMGVMPGTPMRGGGYFPPHPHCKSRPTEGSEGSSGLQGNPGRPGQRGGNSAELIMKIYDRQNFTYLILEQNPGSGGHGGSGGAGGQPGQQGQNGILQKTDEYKRIFGGVPETDNTCPVVPQLQSNPNPGPPGPSGAEGAPGDRKQNLL